MPRARAHRVRGREDARVDEHEPGDPVCWLHRLCPECGAVPSGEGGNEGGDACWRCGKPADDRDADG